MPIAGDIRSWQDAVDSRCNWGWLTGCFGPTISPTDIDFMVPFVVERRSRFLVGEIKRDNQEVPQGQTILLKALASLPQFTVFILVGDIVDHQIYPRRLFLFGEGWREIDRTGFRTFCGQWFQRVNRT